MHYAYDVLVLPAHTASNHLEVTAKLTAGIVRHVSIVFPPGCARLVRCCIWNSWEQLLPSNPDASYYEDGYAIEADCYIPTWQFGNEFTILAWNTGTLYNHLIHVLFDVQDPEEPDLAQSINSLEGIMQSLINVIKSWY